MAGESFFQKIFCSGEVNKYVKPVNNDSEDKLEEVAKNIFSSDVVTEEPEKVSIIKEEPLKVDITKKVDETLGVVFNSDIMSDDNDEIGGQGFSHTTGMMGSKEINDNRNLDVNKAPVVSGLIFDEKDDNDEGDFFVKEQVINDYAVEEVTSSEPIDLINMLKQDGKKEEKVEISYDRPKEESEIDLPVI